MYEGRADAAGKLRLRLKLEIQDGSAKLLSTKFVINNGGTVLQAGIQHDKGLLVLGFTCTAFGRRHQRPDQDRRNLAMGQRTGAAILRG